MRSVLLVAYYYPPANWSGALRPSRFARYLPEYGYQPEVVSEHNVEADGRWMALSSRLLGKVEGGLRRYGEHLDWIEPATRKGRQLVAECNPGVVYSTAPPFSAHLVALRLKREFGLKWVADFRDPLIGNAFRTGRLGGFYDKSLERATFEHADRLVANTDALARTWIDRRPDLADKITVIWNGFNPDEEMPAATASDNGVHWMRHIGSIYGPRDPGQILASVDRLIASGALSAERLRVEFIGPSDMEMPFRSDQAFERLQTLGVVRLSEQAVPRPEALEMTSSADSLLLLDLTGRERNIQLPAKLFEYVRSGRPILAVTTKDSPAERILGQCGLEHTCIYPSDPAGEVDRKLLEFLSKPTSPRKVSDWFNETFDARLITGRLAGLFDHLTA
jgi:hypothetical protein